jgi:hypothetical protein
VHDIASSVDYHKIDITNYSYLSCADSSVAAISFQDRKRNNSLNLNCAQLRVTKPIASRDQSAHKTSLQVLNEFAGKSYPNVGYPSSGKPPIELSPLISLSKSLVERLLPPLQNSPVIHSGECTNYQMIIFLKLPSSIVNSNRNF